jgi:hypothetical protein
MSTEVRPLSEKQLATLLAGLNPKRISRRSQGGAQLSYLEAWDVKATLIRVFGFGGFSADVVREEIVHKEEQQKTGKNGAYKQWKVAVMSTVRLHIKQLDVTYTESAIGDGSMGDITEALDKAVKTASSDALKRCAIYLGTQFGLSLYDNGSTNDVIRVIMAPGQEWPKPLPPAPQPEQQEQAVTPEQEVANLQQIVDGGPNVLPAGNGLTEEQRAENQALLERGLRMKAEKEAEAAPAE